jgi:hypothetical protein
MGRRHFKIFGIIGGLAGLALLFQNATTLDFTKLPAENSSRGGRPSSLEIAISKSENERRHGQKKMGLDDRNIQKKYIKKQRSPDAVVGDIPVEEATKDKARRGKSKKLRNKTQQ